MCSIECWAANEGSKTVAQGECFSAPSGVEVVFRADEHEQ